jgi:hypothetical protein
MDTWSECTFDRDSVHPHLVDRSHGGACEWRLCRRWRVAKVDMGIYFWFMRPSFARDHGQPRGRAKPFDDCTRELENAAELFGMDPKVVSVGIVKMPGGYGLGVRRATAPIRPLLELSSFAVNEPARATIPEQHRRRPLCPGVQLQNWDADARAGVLASERMVVGTLGMVLERNGERLLLSNNHVLAGQNRGCVGDRIAQPGGMQISDSEVVARLERFIPLQPSPAGAHPTRGNVIWNRVDAAVAALAPGIDFDLGFLGAHAVPRPSGYARPVIGERVFKIGRTSGLRWGVITSVGERVGPVTYAIGDCWFQNSFVIEGEGGRPFSEGGDSGAVVVRRTGEVVGLIYAGNGNETFACPITDVLSALA